MQKTYWMLILSFIPILFKHLELVPHTASGCEAHSYREAIDMGTTTMSRQEVNKSLDFFRIWLVSQSTAPELFSCQGEVKTKSAEAY